ncbi:hypothetical protein [Halomonas sp.]|uniref:hypothetical protein n=1 Tax=Halomonas sp. TaxID=1486246 RepID=UPI0035668417
MTRAVVDTNVLLVANDDHEGVSEECIIACIEAIEEIRRRGVVVIDDEWKILGEYHHKLNPNKGQPEPGDAFLKWLLQRQANTKHVAHVPVTETVQDWFEEFPDHDLQVAFDPPDRKFIAVAAADDGNPHVFQAADCKWLSWWPQLAGAGVRFRFVCPEDVKRFYRGKFDGPVPELPQDE